MSSIAKVSERAVHRAFEGVLLALDVLEREPDRWEQETLVSALCSMAGRRYVEAATHIVEVTLSVARQPAGGATDGKSAVTKEVMRRGLDYIRAYH